MMTATSSVLQPVGTALLASLQLTAGGSSGHYLAHGISVRKSS